MDIKQIDSALKEIHRKKLCLELCNSHPPLTHETLSICEEILSNYIKENKKSY